MNIENENRFCRYCGGVAISKSAMYGRVCRECKNKLNRGEKLVPLTSKKHKCRICGKLTENPMVCDPCTRSESKRTGWSVACLNCKVNDICETHNSGIKNGVCKVCGKHDSCMALRNGKCLDCHAKDWNQEHETTFHVPKMIDLLLTRAI